ncbi:MAG: hypothetical protein F4227_07380 [Gammaproteobacteria bacterium]|nr:hypothetical protein [Gammaproteobacteria bacterium]MYF02775.1 hypothetical protein [Gammaproteobacteria bacterium]MYI77592.1 hypothetical protein [Gammaproteobacteria bacterium]
MYHGRDAFLKAGFSGLNGRKSSDSEHRRLEREVAQRVQLIGEMNVALQTLKKFGRLRLTDAVRRCIRSEMAA